MTVNRKCLLVCVLAVASMAQVAGAQEGASKLGGTVAPGGGDLTRPDPLLPRLPFWWDLEDEIPDLVGSRVEPDCTNTNGCPIQSSADCRWQPAFFPKPADPVEVRMAALGIYLDGDLGDVATACVFPPFPVPGNLFVADPSVAFIDRVSDTAGANPGPTGDQEEPAAPGDPSGFNIGCSVLAFYPDSDPTDGVDDSFLYVGWDISDRVNGDGAAPSQFDADDDGDPCTHTAPWSEIDDEFYGVTLQSCADLSDFDPTTRLTNDIHIDDDSTAVMRIHEAVGGVLELQGVSALDLLGFPTADRAPVLIPVVNPTNACIAEELEWCAGGNNVELVVKGVETSGLFGPWASAAPDSDRARQNRFALAQLVALLSADTDADVASEERAVVALFKPLPSIEVTKLVRCVDDGPVDFTTNAEALPGSEVEFEITIKNTGNQDLAVTVKDVMQALSAAGGASCETICGPLVGWLTSPQRGIDEEVNAGNATQRGLLPDFFFDTDVLCSGFLKSIQDNEDEFLGKLLGAQVIRNAGTCGFRDGDTLVIRFRGLVDITDPDAFCAERMPVDCENAVTVSAAVVPPDPDTIGLPCNSNGDCDDGLYCNGEEVCDISGVCVTGPLPCPLADGCIEETQTCGAIVAIDSNGIIDTDAEAIAKDDDNEVWIDILCQDLTFVKEVGFPGNEPSFTTGTDALIVSVPDGGSIEIEYRYSGKNTGEIPQNITIKDAYLCVDVDATKTAYPGEIVLGNCPMCEPPAGEVTLENVPADTDYSTSCVIEFFSKEALEFFLQLDDGRPDCRAELSPGVADPECYRDCAEAIGSNGTGDDVCGDQVVTTNSFATICNVECKIDVEKRVQCLEDCGENANTVGVPLDELAVATGACVRFVIDVTNNDVAKESPICRLKITDDITDHSVVDVKENSVKFSMLRDGAAAPVDCTVPICFNTNSVPCEWDVDCDDNIGTLGVRDTLTITFDATIVGTNGTTRNEILVDGSLCDGGAAFSCVDAGTAGIDILPASLTCLDKSWAFQADTNCDGLPDPPFVATTGVEDAVFPVLLRLCITAENTGDVPLKVKADDPDLVACVNGTAGVSFSEPPPCGLGTSILMPPHTTTNGWCCEILVKSAKAMRDLDACDGTADLVYENTASVSGTITTNGTDICIPNDVVIPGDGVCTARLRVPPPCDITVEKTVVCLDSCTNGAPVGDYVDELAIVPGACARFKIDICNTGGVAIPCVEVDDDIDCPNWFITSNDSVKAVLNGYDVTDCVCPAAGCDEVSDINGVKCFVDCANVPADRKWMLPGECLTITFDVEVPVGATSDCENTINVGGITECPDSVPLVPSCSVSTNATLDVKAPEITCDKVASIDFGTNGSIDAGPNSTLLIDTVEEYPFWLIYELTVTNSGDVPLSDVWICDEELVEDANSAGLDITTCGLCEGACDGDGDADMCRNVGTLAPGESATVTCKFVVKDDQQWEDFAILDGADEDCYDNAGYAVGDVDTTGVCGPGQTVTSDPCPARVCIRPPRDCYPRTKVKVTVWNENETMFTGMHRCIDMWDQVLLRLYAPFGVPNHFLLGTLQTDKGKAVIDGMASIVCDDEEGESIDAPLVGVAHKLLTFGEDTSPRALAGAPLFGKGAENGRIEWDPPVIGGGDEREKGDSTPVGGVSKKGSLLVFPKVELRWTNMGTETTPDWVLTQDTFIEVTNDVSLEVWVEMYFVNGDKPLEATIDERAHDGCNFFDFAKRFTSNEPTYWSVATGSPIGIDPFDLALDPGTPPGRPADDGTGDRVMRGYVLMWAVGQYTGGDGLIRYHEISWNHLTGRAMIVNYGYGAAWEYSPWAFQAVTAAQGEETDDTEGKLLLDGTEYDAAPAYLVFDFYSSGSTVFTGEEQGFDSVIVNTDLTLLPMLQDLRDDD